MNVILETKRLILREMEEYDIPELSAILQDEEVMTAYEHAFSDQEVNEWFLKQRKRYQQDKMGLWAVIEKNSYKMIGQCGITMQCWNEIEVPEIGYLFQKKAWHHGYATEAAIGCKNYAFEYLGFSAVYSIIRDSNYASQSVAKRNQMGIYGKVIKHYYGMDMPHFVYCVKKQEN